MSALRMFIPITKVDVAQRLVYGLATAEAEDRSGEICDYASTKPNYEKWSADIAKSTRRKIARQRPRDAWRRRRRQGDEDQFQRRRQADRDLRQGD